MFSKNWNQSCHYLRHLPRPGRLSRERQPYFGPKTSERAARRRKRQRGPLEWERRRHPAPEGIRAGLDPTLYHSLYRTQLADAPGSADSEGLRPHAPTLEKRSQPNVSFTRSPKLELNPKLQIERPNQKRQTPRPNSRPKTQTELWASPRSVFNCSTLLKHPLSGTEQPGLWLQSA